jgi:glycosyltransferase involved in cell wall biosynthesis
MNNFPLISIIIPSYNRFNYLCRTIDSIKNQTYTNFEIIVINDNSTEPEYLTKEIENVKMIHLK